MGVIESVRDRAIGRLGDRVGEKRIDRGRDRGRDREIVRGERQSATLRKKPG